MERITYQEVPQEMFELLRNIEKYIHNSSIEKSIINLMKLRGSQINGCAYCVDMHYKESKHDGETELRLSSLCVWKDTPYFSEKERAVLTYTEALTLLEKEQMTNEVFDTLTNYYSKEEICHLSFIITQINTWNRLMKAFQFTPGNYVVA